jgi:hypothetical protein
MSLQAYNNTLDHSPEDRICTIVAISMSDAKTITTEVHVTKMYIAACSAVTSCRDVST